ncbi:Wadjet anti-phage system protein JetD domain-containing protein [Chitinophaga nivalis]|uniref:DUF2220 family protein n=1 Tax=Chitinophaga nivalis TaxID=2991709 RepID=A0ABT3IQ51_9BACT|nr:Wadjet anti-phage system protein JetD domain-containing protein [Chitinophaga nivalis]MCW3464389.1 DUF2220 family protein [Chitinophaga nivalis]MCW3485920.1 DUF2220 family protein [Chitinophaga nivalis]
MISPEEIKVQASKWWKPLLQSKISGAVFFPKVIDRIGKVKSDHITQRFELLQQEITILYHHSKNQTGIGYLVKTAGHNFRRTGSHELPDAIVFETMEDYLFFTGKKKEWNVFLASYESIMSEIPALKDWTWEHCLWLTDHNVKWVDVLKVCHYFIQTPRPNLYLRQLPIAIHTKFIEDNTVLIKSLLDFLIPGDIRDLTQKRFAERFFLKYNETLVRIRILDDHKLLDGRFSDISIPLSDFEKAEFTAEYVLITENQMNFLALPPIPSTIAIWSGGGFNISYLKRVMWLQHKKIFYWGDIDEHGFQILHQLRSYYPLATSIMMDRITFDLYNEYAVEGFRNKSERLGSLTEEENEMYQHLKTLHKNNRLEQEKLPQVYIDSYLGKISKK